MKRQKTKLNDMQKNYLNTLIDYYDIEKNYETLDTFAIEALWIMGDDEQSNDDLQNLVNEFFLFKFLECSK
jgi:hypothetical protein